METAKNPAISLGKAIQLINILRDASTDAALGRIYLPQDMLRENNVKEDDIFLLQSKPGYCRVVKSVSERAHQLLSEAEAGRSTLPGVLGPFFVQIIVELYRGYLEKLETMDYNNLSIGGERVRISTYQKVTASVKAISTLLFAPNSSL